MHIVDFAVRTAAVVIRGAIPTREAGLDEERLVLAHRGFMNFFFTGSWR
jgi:hypothetical protein